MEAHTKHFFAVSLEVMTQIAKSQMFCFSLNGSKSKATAGSGDRSVAEAGIFFGAVYRVSVLWVDSQGPVTHTLMPINRDLALWRK